MGTTKYSQTPAKIVRVTYNNVVKVTEFLVIKDFLIKHLQENHPFMKRLEALPTCQLIEVAKKREVNVSPNEVKFKRDFARNIYETEATPLAYLESQLEKLKKGNSNNIGKSRKQKPISAKQQRLMERLRALGAECNEDLGVRQLEGLLRQTLMERVRSKGKDVGDKSSVAQLEGYLRGLEIDKPMEEKVVDLSLEQLKEVCEKCDLTLDII